MEPDQTDPLSSTCLLALAVRLVRELGLPAAPAVGERVQTSGDAPHPAGTVLGSESSRVTLLLDEPAPGTAFVAVEGDGDAVAVSVS